MHYNIPPTQDELLAKQVRQSTEDKLFESTVKELQAQPREYGVAALISQLRVATQLRRDIYDAEAKGATQLLVFFRLPQLVFLGLILWRIW